MTEEPNEPFLVLKENGIRYKVLTLAFIIKGDQVLLGLKKRGFGASLWNGFGGKVDIGESIPEAAVREIKEECGLTVKEEELEQIAVIDFEFVNEPVVMRVPVFKSTKFTGEVVESEEMKPKWYPINEIPHHQMWADAKIWYPLLFEGTRFKAHFLIEGHTNILSYKIMNWGNDKVLQEMKK